MSSLRRHMMMQSGASYILEGLVFWLDGIDKGGVDGKWVDLIGGKSFTNHGATVTPDGWSFDGVDDYMIADSFFQHSPVGHTIEICVEFSSDTNRVVYTEQSEATDVVSMQAYYRKTSYNIIWCTKEAGSYGAVGAYSYTFSNKRCDSMNANRGIGFVTQLTQVSNLGQTAGHKGNAMIGRRNYPASSTQLYSEMRLHSIRIYNRILSEADMIANHMYDNIRFNLGL